MHQKGITSGIYQFIQAEGLVSTQAVSAHIRPVPCRKASLVGRGSCTGQVSIAG